MNQGLTSGQNVNEQEQQQRTNKRRVDERGEAFKVVWTSPGRKRDPVRSAKGGLQIITLPGLLLATTMNQERSDSAGSDSMAQANQRWFGTTTPAPLNSSSASDNKAPEAVNLPRAKLTKTLQVAREERPSWSNHRETLFFPPSSPKREVVGLFGPESESWVSLVRRRAGGTRRRRLRRATSPQSWRTR